MIAVALVTLHEGETLNLKQNNVTQQGGSTHLLKSRGLVSGHQPAHDDVLQENDLERWQDGAAVQHCNTMAQWQRISNTT